MASARHLKIAAITPEDWLRPRSPAGAYLLLLRLARPVRPPPRLGPVPLSPGLYVYCGSARGPGGIRARCLRHLLSAREPHWHIDRLCRAATAGLAIPFPGAEECRLLAALLERPGTTVARRGFGSSDCRRCPAHLLVLTDVEALTATVSRAAGGSLPPALAFRRRRGSRRFFLVEQDALRGAVEILELAAAQRPEKGEQADEPESQGDRHQIDENIHHRRPRVAGNGSNLALGAPGTRRSDGDGPVRPERPGR